MKEPSKQYWSEEARKRHLGWNYGAYIADGAVYMAGLAFLSPESVLPTMVSELGGPSWLVALSPALMFIGSMITPLLMVHKVEKLDSYKRFTFNVGIPHRFVPAAAALALLVGWHFAPGPAIWMASLAPFLIGVTGGLTSAGFWQLYSKLLPANKRLSNSAWRYGIGLLVGYLAGAVITIVLDRFPGREGYGILFLLQFLGFALSGVCFSLLREYPDPPHEARPHRELGDVLKKIPQVLREEHIFRRYMLARALGQAHFIILPFMALHFRGVLGLPESFLGRIVQAQMLGGLLGAVIAGYLGDRKGAKLPICIARGLMLITCAATFWVSAPWQALACFFLIGMVVYMLNISEYTFVLELTTSERLPSMVAVQSLLLMPVTLGFGLLSKWLFQAGEGIAWHGLVSGLFLLVSLWLLSRIPDPRQTKG